MKRTKNDQRQATPPTRATVLILSTNPAFAREVSTHWPGNSNPPEFTVLEDALFRDLAGHYDLAIADASAEGSRARLKQALAAAGKPAILIHHDASLSYAHGDGKIIELCGHAKAETEQWPALAGLLGQEILSRCHADARVRDAETACAAYQAEATVGRYMSEMRHNVNNALTTILGNAELLTLEPGLPAPALSQADTILNMALRLHEVFQRFSSLEKELSVATRESDKRLKARGTASGS